jgi:arylsulfatase
MGSYFGGIRQPLAISYPRKIKADKTARPQFHHVIDVVPTIYELTKITPPRVVNGFEQDAFDGVSMVYSFDDPEVKGKRTTQFFDIMASRGIYHDGWFASAPGPRQPWVGGLPKGIKEWSPLTDKWELYNIDEDWSQANDLASTNPQKLEEMKALFIVESTKNKNLPIGGGLWSTAMFHPEDAPAPLLTEWTFSAPVTGMPESAAPKLGKNSSIVTLEVDVPKNANGVLYALAGFAGGLTCYMKEGFLNYEFNLFEVQRTKIKSKSTLPVGKVKIEVESKLTSSIGGPMDITLKVNGEIVAQGTVPATISLHFGGTSTFDIGTDLYSPVSLDYYDQAPFPFNGKIGSTKISYLK